MVSRGVKRSTSYCGRSSGCEPNRGHWVRPLRATNSMAWAANVWASQRYSSTSLCKRSRFCERLPSVTSRTPAGMESRARRRRASVICDLFENSSACRQSRWSRRASDSGRGSPRCSAASTAAGPRGSRGTFGHGLCNLEIVPHNELHAARLSGNVDSAEGGTEVGIVQGDAPVRMIEHVEALGAELDGVAFVHGEASIDGEIEDVVAGANDRVAAGVAESVRRGRAEGRGIEEVFDGALAARQSNALAGHEVGTIGRAGVGVIDGEEIRILGRAILQRDGAGELPAAQQRAGDSRFRQPPDVAPADAAAHVEERKAALQAQVAFVLRADAIVEPRNYAVGIVQRLGPNEAGQHGDAAREALLDLHLE